MLRSLLASYFLLNLHQIVAVDKKYTLYACDKDPKENGICNPIPWGRDEDVDYNNVYDNTAMQPDAISNTYHLHKVNIWVLVPFENCYPFSKSLIEPAVYRALKDENVSLCSNVTEDDATILEPCYQVMMNNTSCDEVTGLITAMEIEQQRNLAEKCGESATDMLLETDILLGMSCDFVASRVSGLSTNWNWPEVLPGVRSQMFDNKDQGCCRTTTRTGHSATDLGQFVYEYYNLNGELWNSSYLLYTTSGNGVHGAPLQAAGYTTDCTFLISGVTDTFRNKNMNYTIFPEFSSDQYVIDNAEKILLQLQGVTRVTLWCVSRKAMRVIMNTAARLGMTKADDAQNAYTFTYIDIYNPNATYSWSNEQDYVSCKETNDTAADSNDVVGNSMEGMEALQVVTLHRPQTTKYQSFSDDMMAATNTSGSGQFVNHYITHYYNSVRLIVHGVTENLRWNPKNVQNGTAFANELWNTTFESVDGTVYINERGNQHMSYAIMDLKKDSNLFEEVSVYYGYNKTWNHISAIDWPGTIRPASAPPCGESFVCIEEVKEMSVGAIVGIAFSVALLVCLLIISFIARRKVLKEEKLREMLWKIKLEDIFFDSRLGRRMSRLSDGTDSTAGSGSNGSGAFGRQVFTKTAEWNHQVVAIKYVDLPKKLNVDRKLQVEMNQMMSLSHEHLCKFMGVCIDGPVMVLTEYCPRGSLQDFLEGDMYGKLDDMFRNSLISDIARGMLYIHKSPIQTHGSLKSSNCLVDGRLVVKVTDFGLPSFRQRHRRDSVIGYDHFKDLLWTAPELLRLDYNEPFKGTQKGDVYSFAILVQEILYRMGPFYMGGDADASSLSPTEICRRVQDTLTVPFRPTLQDDDYVVVGEQIRTMVSRCWEEIPEYRPPFAQIVDIMKKFTKKQNLIDRMVDRLEQYSTNLEDKVEERTIQYRAEKERADNLLYQMLPKPVAEMLKSRREVTPHKYDCVTIYFSDIVGFTAISHKSNAFEVVTMLHDLYTAFDRVVDRFDVYKVETIGDAYMVTSGLPEENGNLHVREIARTALYLMEEAKHFRIPHMPNETLKIRVGIHSGPVVTGVVGEKMPRYCLFGDTVNTAARMEQSGEGMRIHLSPKAKSLLDNFDTFVVKERENPVPLKGLGTWRTWWLEKENIDLDDDSIATLKPPVKLQNFNNNLQDAKKVSHTSDYGSARSSLIEVERAVTGVGDNDFKKTSDPLVTVEQHAGRSSGVSSNVYSGTEPKKRRGTAILMEEAEISSLTNFYVKQREKSFGYLPGFSKTELHDGYSTLNLPITSKSRSRDDKVSNSHYYPVNFTDEITKL